MSMTDDVPELDDTTAPQSPEPDQPLYRVYEDSRLAISSAVGKVWKNKLDAALKAYADVMDVWTTVIQYYNNDQTKIHQSPRGVFKRGDNTENVIFSNLNVMLPAVYGKDPNITCSTIDKQDEPFCQALQALINELFRRKTALGAKPKIKKACGIGLLTNQGILKLTFTKKDDSREYALNEMQRITNELAHAEDAQAVDELYGELEALEMNMEVLEPSGPGLGNVLPHNLIIDPYAEQPDAMDAMWMIERTFINTAALNARYTKREDDQDDKSTRVLVYKPTHKASFSKGAGNRDDGLGMVMEALNHGDDSSDDERKAYIDLYYSECYLVWDKATRRVMLFHKDDWKWPIWVWDDPLGITRFFPYFVFGFSLSTGGTTSVGETAYILDHQDEINDINRQVARIRRSIFDFFFYNSDITNADEVEKLLNAVRGGTATSKHVVGVRAGERKVSDLIETLLPPAANYEKFFDKQGLLDAINRITNTSDALRGVQFRTNTNVASVNSYQESMRLSVGAKVDVVEDIVGEIAVALSELCVVHFDETTVAGYIGETLAKAWQQMDIATFNSTYSVNLVAGSLEKPNSVFKKKEAVEIAQAIGQFARAAPGAALRIILRVLEQAFTEVVIKKEDWDALDQEVAAATQKGISTGAQGTPDLQTAAQNLPPEVKQQVVQMHQQGVPDQQIIQYIQQQLKGTGNGAPRQQPAQ